MSSNLILDVSQTLACLIVNIECTSFNFLLDNKSGVHINISREKMSRVFSPQKMHLFAPTWMHEDQMMHGNGWAWT